MERLDQFSIRQAKQRCINDLKRQTKFEKSQVESAITLSINQQRTALFEWLDYGNVRDEDTVKEKFRELQSGLQQALKREISRMSEESSCDGIDSDCDGIIDEDLTAPLNSNQNGICAGSVQLCHGET